MAAIDWPNSMKRRKMMLEESGGGQRRGLFFARAGPGSKNSRAWKNKAKNKPIRRQQQEAGNAKSGGDTDLDVLCRQR
jgi:hypothetical protein